MTGVHHRQGPTSARGFTLIEVLIAASVLLLSMTGLLTVQLTGVRLSQNAYHRTQATNLAYQMTDYLRAACDSIDAYTGETLCRSGNQNPNDERACTISAESNVTGHTIADENLRAWWSAINDANLPFWYATVQARDARLVNVVVQWDDTRATETALDSAEIKTSCLGGPIPAPMEEVCFTTAPCGATL